jgi:hypothetical protein
MQKDCKNNWLAFLKPHRVTTQHSISTYWSCTALDVSYLTFHCRPCTSGAKQSFRFSLFFSKSIWIDKIQLSQKWFVEKRKQCKIVFRARRVRKCKKKKFEKKKVESETGFININDFSFEKKKSIKKCFSLFSFLIALLSFLSKSASSKAFSVTCPGRI